ncbi:matrixin family metalloprotease [Rheinheimera maricola]|uniref:Matrixin family metalloprotease n=1 Tax=Rheinheimera maricola TaxID=2793282 RepID=A0ABS7XC43_9GAMM|nr:matrixin family metalloprotease [Rheinheimera maricola]MBZ9613106.1 matrixin family metalloprotease [Rheinheimera maricola]
MKFFLRALFYVLLLYASYQVVSALVRKDAPAAQLLQQYADKAMQQFLCQTPVTWRIGQLDPAFDLTLEQAEQAAHRAAEQWNKALGRELFRYDSLDGFAINFAFDQRQQQLLQQARLKRNLARYDANIDQRQANLQQQAKQLKQRQEQFSRQNEQYTADASAFEQRAQQATAANLAALQQQQNQLQQRQQQLQQQADALNEQQQRLLREQRYLNETVADRNALLPNQAAEIAASEVGTMQINGRTRSMTIFAYTSATALELTLLHEFGHALGLGHTDKAESVMYFALSAEQSGLTDTDVQALKQQCGL